MAFDEGIAHRNGVALNIQCLKINLNSPSANFRNRYHYHKYIELIYILDGNLTAYIGDETYSVNASELIFVYSNEPHTYKSKTHCTYIVIKFLPEILYTSEQTLNEFEYTFNMTSNVLQHTRIIGKNSIIDALMINAFNEYQKAEYCYEWVLRSYVIKVCAAALRTWKMNDEISMLENTVSKQLVYNIQKITKYVKNTNGNIKTHQAAKMCNISDGYFSRVFKAVMNMTFTEYLKSVKINEAERMLKCTDETVTDISQALNYATVSHFIEDFKRVKKISPKQYRKQHVESE